MGGQIGSQEIVGDRFINDPKMDGERGEGRREKEVNGIYILRSICGIDSGALGQRSI